jgi:mono/diheme cytochrome c family protein
VNKIIWACQQVDGSGVPGMYPPLSKSDWASGNKPRIIQTVLLGLSGKIEVNENYFDQTMPKVDYISEEQIAQILTNIRREFNNIPDSVKANEVKRERAKLKK